MANLVVKKAIKTMASEKGMRFPDSAIEALDRRVKETAEKAMKRAEGNARKTVKDIDV